METRVWMLDLDGTLIKTPELFYFVMQKLGRKESWEEVRTKLGNKGWEAWVAQLPEEDLRRIITKEMCSDVDWSTPGAREFLKRCKTKGEPCFLLTHTPVTEICQRVVGQGLTPYFQGICDFPSTPKNELIKIIMRSYHFSPSQCAMVGDTTMDIDAGRDAGIRSYGVTFGLATESEIVEAGGIPIYSFDVL